MAINRATQYPGRWNTPDADSPQGAGKNRTAPGSNDGSYFEKVMWDDMDSLSQSLFIASGIAINGAPDTGTASQHFDALINNRWNAIGNYSVGSVVVGSDGNQYKAVSDSGRDSVVLNPVGAPDRSVWVQYPHEDGSNSNGDYRLHHDGTIEQWGITPQSLSDGRSTTTLPIPFSSTNYNVTIAERTSSGGAISDISKAGFEVSSATTSTFVIRFGNSSDLPAINETANFYARGK